MTQFLDALNETLTDPVALAGEMPENLRNAVGTDADLPVSVLDIAYFRAINGAGAPVKVTAGSIYPIAADGGIHFSYSSALNVVNHFEAQGATAGSGPVLGIVGSDTNVDINWASKGTGKHVFGNGTGTLFEIGSYAGATSPSVRFSVRPGDTSGSYPRITSTGIAEYAVPLSMKHSFIVNGGEALVVDQIGSATPTNYLAIRGGVTTDFVRITAQSATETNVPLYINTKGSSGITLANASGSVAAFDSNGVATARVNYYRFRNGATTIAPQILADGTDTNIDIQFVPKGTGVLKTSSPIIFRPGASVSPPSNGDVTFELTSNTTLTIRARGSDGTVRSATVTLA